MAGVKKDKIVNVGNIMGCHSRVDRALSKSICLPLNRCSKYVVFSDCHRGSGSVNDNFLKNRHLYMAALQHYLRDGYYYLELGDGEELWENRHIQSIIDSHEEVYQLHLQFQKRNRFTKIYGNHDMELRDELPESIHLDNEENGRDIYMIHGHQADFWNCVCWKLSRFLVRHVWKPLERVGVKDPTSAARNYKKAQNYEKCLESWTMEHEEYLLAGHSHRPRLSTKGNRYMNAGSCVHPSGITCIEIEDMKITLVKWVVETRMDFSLYVAREILSGPIEIL